jgi:hypothetical protein
MRAISLFVLMTVLGSAAPAQPTTLVEWRFDRPNDLDGWTQSNHVRDLRVEQGALQGRIMDWDPFVRSPQFEITATPYQRVELRMKSDCGGAGELYWTGTTESPYGGFSPEKRTSFQIIGDGAWHEYQIDPFWQNERKIILLRLDFARPEESDYGKKSFAVDSIRIVDLGQPEVFTGEAAWDFTRGALGWHASLGASVQPTSEGLRFASGPSAASALRSGALRCPIGDNFWVHVEMQVDAGTAGYMQWVSSEHAGLQSARFPVRADGRFHIYNVDMSGHRPWSGDALLLALQPSNASGATAVVRRIALGPDPQGGPQAECTYLGLEDAVCRAGRPAHLVLHLTNRGGTATAAGQVRIGELSMPDGVAVTDDSDWRALPALDPFLPATHRVRVQAETATEGEVAVRLTGSGAPAEPLTGTIRFLEPLDLPHADYVPPPQPAESDYDVGAFYFPGWDSPARWEPIRTHAPHRKPVLGWYDEGNPECVDWQIKWAVEHGITFFLVDWYWSAGQRQLEHWLEAYQQARYRSYLPWAVMWANHNRPGTHSEQDMRDVAEFWVEHYFGMPEYLRWDGKPVVMIWSPENIRRDLGGEDGGKRALEIARQVAREAGYDGIYFIAMKWPEASTDPAIVRRLADDGYDMTSIYHYMHHGGRAEDPTHFPFELVAQSSAEHWRSWHQAGILPFLPNLATGWDSRPWHGDGATVIHGRSVELFRAICEDAKRFADETGIKRMALAPLNEWGEGSYIEPNQEFGFGMYEALRDVFCQPPAGGWPMNITPADVALGPYDFPEQNQEPLVAWMFETDSEGWGPLMGVTELRHADGAIHFQTTSNDPAIHAVLYGADARKHRFVRIRMKIDTGQPRDRAQLFWSTTTSPVSEANSVRFDPVADGQYHDYVIPVHENRRWSGRIATLRFDPCNHPGAGISVAEVRLTEHADRDP